MLRDPGVFDVAWVPGDLRHREEELEDLASILNAYRATPVRIIGPSGVGKTATVRYALEDIGLHLDGVETAYVDAWDQHRPSRTLHALLEELAAKTGPLHPRSPTGELLAGIREAIDDEAVVVIDEADMLQERELLLELHAIDHLKLVLVANRDEDVVDGLGTVQSNALQDGERLAFERYSVDALVDILRPRAREGIHGRVDDDVLQAIAMQADGDARNAIKCLEMAARLADERDLDSLERELIDEAMERAKSFVRQKASERLRHEEHLIYEILREAGSAQMGQIYRTYEAEVDAPKSQRSVRKWLRKMRDYNLIRIEGSTSDRRYEYIEPPEELVGWLKGSV